MSKASFIKNNNNNRRGSDTPLYREVLYVND